MRMRTLFGTTLFTTAILLWAASASALTIQTVQFVADGGTQPVWGQSLTINVGATIPDASIPPVVDLDLVGFRTGDPGIGSPDRTSVYLHVYDAFSITAGGAPSSLGSFIGASSNSLDLSVLSPSTDAIWLFDEVLLDKDVEYFYVMANVAGPATLADLVYSDFEVGTGNPHGGGQAFHQTGDMGGGPLSEDVYFRVLSSEPIPEPGTGALLALGLTGLGVARRRS